ESSEWNFSSFGSKACGGPVGFIAYSTKIDVELFLEKVEKHKIEQKKFNEKWGIISDCSVPPEPTGVICKDGEPSFIYSNTKFDSKQIQLNPVPEKSIK